MKRLAYVMAFFAALAMATAVPTINWGSYANPSVCDTRGKPVVNVVQDIENTIDSGTVDYRWWARDDLTRQIQVFEQRDGTYCVFIQNEGNFTVPDFMAGMTSPLGTATLTGDEEGTFQGDIYYEVDSELKDDPLWGKRGRIETLDYGCDLQQAIDQTPGVACDRPSTVLGAYFKNVDFREDIVDSAFAYQYNAEKNCGRMTQSSDGYEGDITCATSPAGGPGN